MNRETKREVVATLLKAGRRDLAQVVAGIVTAYNEEELFLWNVKTHKPSYRKSEWDYLKERKKVTREFDEVAVDLVKQGLFKRSKSGALLLTPKGKQASTKMKNVFVV